VLELVIRYGQASGISIKYKLFPQRNDFSPTFWSNTFFAFEKLVWKLQFTID